MNIISDHLISASVVDQSIQQLPDTPVEDNTVCLLQPIFSSRGRDREILEWKTPGDLLSFYGSDILNVKQYGQGGLNAYGFLRSGGRVMACRLLPKDAARAALVVSIHIKSRADIPQWERDSSGAYVLDATGNKVPIMVVDPGTEPPEMIQLVASGFEVKLSLEAVTTFDEFGKPIVSSSEVVDGDWTKYPLFYTYHYGKGKCGNDFGFSITPDRARDKATTDGRRYQLFLFETTLEGNLVQLDSEPVYFSFNPEAKFSTVSTFAEGLNLVYPAKLGTRENPVQLEYFPESYDKIITHLSSALPTESKFNIDFIFMRNILGYDYDKIVPSVDNPDFSNSVTFMRNGHDGSLQVGNVVKDDLGADVVVTQAIVNTTRENLLLEFFRCDTDVKVLDERLVDSDLVLDSYDYSAVVKTSILTDFHKYRPDVFKVLGVGDPKSAREAEIMYGTLSTNIDGDTAFNTSVYAHAGVTIDPDLPRQYRALCTYELGRMIAETYRIRRYDVIAGYNNGRVRRMKLDWLARKTKNDEIGRLIERKINFAQQLTKDGIIAFMREDTQYERGYSKLNSMRNGMLVGDAIRRSKQILVKYAYDTRGAFESMRLAEEELKNTFASRYPSGIVVKVKVYQTKRDTVTENAHCDIIVYFPDVPKGFQTTVIAKRLSDLETDGGN